MKENSMIWVFRHVKPRIPAILLLTLASVGQALFGVFDLLLNERFQPGTQLLGRTAKLFGAVVRAKARDAVEEG